MAIAEPPGQSRAVVGDGAADRRLRRGLEILEANPLWALAALMLAAGVLIMYLGRGLTFYYDEWDFVQKDYGGGWHILVMPHVGNIVFFPAIAYKVLFHIAGLNHYWVFRLAVVVLHLTCGACVYVLASRRTTRVASLLAAALVLFMGAAWEDLLWAFQMSYLMSIAFGLLAWVLIEREERWADLGAMVFLVLSIGSVSLGIAITAGVFVQLAWRRQWRRMWVIAVPLILYAAWYLHYGESQVTGESLIHAPGFAADLAASAVGALVGRGLDWGRPLALVGLILLVVRAVRPGAMTPRLAGMIALALVLWVLTAITRSTISAPETSRYAYLGAVAVALIGVEMLRGVAVAPRLAALAAVIVVYAALTGLTTLHSGAQSLRSISTPLKAQLGALQLAASHAPPEYRPNPVGAPTLEAGPYLHTVRSIGSSPADTPAQIAAAEPAARADADKVLVALYAPAPVAVREAGLPAAVRQQLRAPGAAGSSCQRLAPTAGHVASGVFTLTGGGALIRDSGGTPVALALRRFGEEFTGLAAAASPHALDRLAVPADAAGVPWQLQAQSTSAFVVCSVAG